MKRLAQTIIVFVLILFILAFSGGALEAANPTKINVALHQGNFTKSGTAYALFEDGSPLIAIKDLASITGSTTAWYSDISAIGFTNHNGTALMSARIKAIYRITATVSINNQSSAAEESVAEESVAEEVAVPEVNNSEEAPVQTSEFAPITYPETSAESGQNQIPDDVSATVTWTYKKVALTNYIVAKNGTNYLPVSYLKSLGYSVTWNSTTNTLHITVPEGVYIQPAPAAEITKAKTALKNDLPKGMISSYTTYYKTSQYNRSINVTLATKAINGTIVQPGETFSFNQTVGPRTAERGYKTAIVYSGGQMVYGLGGGICQVSSTLYNTVLKGNFRVVERWPHSLPVSYVPTGKDASVSWGNADFRFQNNYSFPIKIVASANNGTLTVSIYYA